MPESGRDDLRTLTELRRDVGKLRSDHEKNDKRLTAIESMTARSVDREFSQPVSKEIADRFVSTFRHAGELHENAVKFRIRLWPLALGLFTSATTAVFGYLVAMATHGAGH